MPLGACLHAGRPAACTGCRWEEPAAVCPTGNASTVASSLPQKRGKMTLWAFDHGHGRGPGQVITEWNVSTRMSV